MSWWNGDKWVAEGCKPEIWIMTVCFSGLGVMRFRYKDKKSCYEAKEYTEKYTQCNWVVCHPEIGG